MEAYTNSSFWISLWISLGASLIAAFLVPPFIALWNEYIWPRFVNRYYKGPRINYTWKGTAVYVEHGLPKTDVEKVVVNQMGESVSGEMIAQLPEEFVVYAFKGEIVNSILTASYWKKGSNSSHDRGTIALKMIDDDHLSGFFTYYEDNIIYGGSYSWEK